MSEIKLSISIVIPAFNAETTLAACLDAVRRAEPTADEIIVIDDGSTDRTKAIAQEKHVTIIELPCNKGRVAARRAGFIQAKGI